MRAHDQAACPGPRAIEVVQRGRRGSGHPARQRVRPRCRRRWCDPVMAAGASGGRWQAGQATQGEIPRAPRCCCRDAEIRLPSAAATSGPGFGTAHRRDISHSCRSAASAGVLQRVHRAGYLVGAEHRTAPAARADRLDPALAQLVDGGAVLHGDRSPTGKRPGSPPRASRRRGPGPPRPRWRPGRLGPVSECARRSRDTRLTLSGYSTAILQAGHSWRRYRPARTWPGSTLAEWQFAARDRARAI